VEDDVLVYSETPVVTSSISRFDPSTQFFGGAHRGRVCVYVSVYVCTMFLKKHSREP
jgi:hypothetical protein